MNNDMAALKVFQQARNKDRVLTPEDVSKATGLNIHTVYAVLARLARNGDLEKTGRGLYRLAIGYRMALGAEPEPAQMDVVVVDNDANVIEATMDGATVYIVNLAVNLWFRANQLDDGILLDADIMRSATEGGWGFHDIHAALTMLGAEPTTVAGDLPATRIPRGKLLLTKG